MASKPATKPAPAAAAPAPASASATPDEVDQINKRLAKILDTRLDTDKEALEALTDLSTFFTDNTLQSRRNLRSRIERRSLAINADFLAAFQAVKESFDTVCSDISAMSASMANMQQQLRTTQSQTADLIRQTNALQATGGQLQLQQLVAGAFLQRFQLTVDEHQQLYGTASGASGGGGSAPPAAPITAAFFEVLARVQAIHGECRVLLQSGYQTAALDIMEEMTLHQEAALERLYRWTQTHCRQFVATAAGSPTAAAAAAIAAGKEDVGGVVAKHGESSPASVGNLVVAAMCRLQDRPVLFKYVLDEYATARRAILVRDFIDALTGGSGDTGSASRAIELHAHDPRRYIGDMFAWIHQAVPQEAENLAALLRDCDRADCGAHVQQAMRVISDGLCGPLKVRVETVLNAERDLITLYAVSNLMRFYQRIVGAVVRGGQLEECLGALQAFSERAYLGALGAQVRVLLQQQSPGGGGGGGGGAGGLEAPQSDLVPPHGVARLLGVLKEILSVASMVESRQNDITKIVSCVIDPLLHAVTESASHLPPIDMAVYLLNCLYQMQSTLAMYEYVDERLERLQGQSDAQLDTLTSEQASSLVANLNLGPIYTLLQQRDAAIDLSHMRAFHDKFEAFLDVPEMLLLAQVNLLQSSTHRTTVQRRAFSVIVAIYRQLFERVRPTEVVAAVPQQPDDGGGELAVAKAPVVVAGQVVEDTLFRRSPAEVEELLSG